MDGFASALTPPGYVPLKFYPTHRALSKRSMIKPHGQDETRLVGAWPGGVKLKLWLAFGCVQAGSWCAAFPFFVS